MEWRGVVEKQHNEALLAYFTFHTYFKNVY